MSVEPEREPKGYLASITQRDYYGKPIYVDTPIGPESSRSWSSECRVLVTQTQYLRAVRTDKLKKVAQKEAAEEVLRLLLQLRAAKDPVKLLAQLTLSTPESVGSQSQVSQIPSEVNKTSAEKREKKEKDKKLPPQQRQQCKTEVKQQTVCATAGIGREQSHWRQVFESENRKQSKEKSHVCEPAVVTTTTPEKARLVLQGIEYEESTRRLQGTGFIPLPVCVPKCIEQPVMSG